jgi:RNA ligase (TIGR02306 family)
MSTHEVLVVKVEDVKKHPNADLLEIIKVSGYDYSIIAKKDDFKLNDLAVFIEPDYVVPLDRPEFSFLKKGRITATRLRGVWSEGLLIKAKSHHKLGDNVIEEYRITRWEPPPQNNRGWGNEGSNLECGWVIPGPEYEIPKYSVENYKKYSRLVDASDTVFYTVKIHGANARFVYSNGQMYAGSRTTWKRKPDEIVESPNKIGEVITKKVPNNSWWTALDQNPWIEKWCKENPDCVLYGEIYGPDIQGNKFHYGLKKGEIGFRVFDVLMSINQNPFWMGFRELIENPKFIDLQIVPILFHGKHDSEKLKEFAESNEDSLNNCGENQIREGIVIHPEWETNIEGFGRYLFKYVSNNYLTRS